MEKDLSNYRKSYEKKELLESAISDNPMQQFQDWFEDVDSNHDEGETNAMTLATIGLDGYPKNRVVLLKKITKEGFVFYTNYNSEKGKSIERNPNVCLSFFWHRAERQVIIKGKAEKISDTMSDTYFKSRPRGSQLGALVSHQSQVLKDREEIEIQLEQLVIEYEGKEIPRPTYWGGYIVKPMEMEFWQGRANRLHDRIRYRLSYDHKWTKCRLSP